MVGALHLAQNDIAMWALAVPVPGRAVYRDIAVSLKPGNGSQYGRDAVGTGAGNLADGDLPAGGLDGVENGLV